MKSFIKNTLLGSALVLCAAGSASANQLLVFVTPGQIATLAGSGIYSSSVCNSGITNCGVYAVGFAGASGGTAGQTITKNDGQAWISPDSIGTDKWSADTVSGTGCTGGCSAFKVGGPGATEEQFITNNTNTVGKTYTANIGDVNLIGVSALTSTTDARGMGFLLTFATNVAAGTTTNVSFRLLAARLNADGTQASKNSGATGTISGLTLYATPEPGSIGLLAFGLGALGVAVRRRRKQ